MSETGEVKGAEQIVLHGHWTLALEYSDSSSGLVVIVDRNI